MNDLPSPFAPEGELHLYTPAQAAKWLPWTARTLKEKAYRREIVHSRGSRNSVQFSGADIRDVLRAQREPVLPAAA
ncbi:helix-turn-helix domain-containing protein [Streptomyces lonarensis]|uniref:Helix-turn-helix domain-containing protein n=1 Tax=Streptomyces lonarensis TaxID=700599 RepID=A0A7X6CXJ1_9ACTN|nr:helix-turn-helix domain-containing protein [Streptomyces lonarensis]NJQ04234.1 helix-turn-helix domain-containing protein [Streptomyces lonarensis]